VATLLLETERAHDAAAAAGIAQASSIAETTKAPRLRGLALLVPPRRIELRTYSLRVNRSAD
jgi:hypothetical protein